MVARNDEFPSLQIAREAINRHVISEGESYKVLKSDKGCYVIICRDYKDCKFRIRASALRKAVRVTVFDSHTCSPITYYKFKQASSVWYLKKHHQASILDN